MDNNTYLIIKLAEEQFGINVTQVIEAAEPGEITQVPNTAPYVKGITNFRGDILTVIDMRIKFNMLEKEMSPEDVIVVLTLEKDNKTIRLGALVDAVKDVVNVDFEKISDIPEIGTKYNTDFIEGIIQKNEQFVVLLKIDEIFSVDEITIITESGMQNNEEN